MTVLPHAPVEWFWVYRHRCSSNSIETTCAIAKVCAWAKTPEGKIIGLLSGILGRTESDLLPAPHIVGSAYVHKRDLFAHEVELIAEQDIHFCDCLMKNGLCP